MALVKCPECKEQVSDKAETCPNCGLPELKANLKSGKKTKVSSCLGCLIVVMGSLIAIVIVLQLTPEQPSIDVPRDSRIQLYAHSHINVRSGRSTDFPVIDKLVPGQSVLGDSLISDWYRIGRGEQSPGYVLAKLLSRNPPEIEVTPGKTGGGGQAEYSSINPIALGAKWSSLGLAADIPWRESNLSGWISQHRCFVGRRLPNRVTANEVNAELLGYSRNRISYIGVEAEIYNRDDLTETLELASRALRAINPPCPSEVIRAFGEQRGLAHDGWKVERRERRDGFDILATWGTAP